MEEFIHQWETDDGRKFRMRYSEHHSVLEKIDGSINWEAVLLGEQIEIPANFLMEFFEKEGEG